jgi:dTDP-4-dehydrorhamnose reductase
MKPVSSTPMQPTSDAHLAALHRLEDSLTARTVAIVGASGQLGRALVATFGDRQGWTVRSLGHQDIEIADRASVERALDPLPDVVINSTLQEWSRQDDVDLALRTNALGPRFLAERCAAGNALLVHISTDFVFDGGASVPYRESDPTAPATVYGITKLAGEQLVRAAWSRHLIVRVAYLFGPGGSRAKGGTNIVTVLLDAARRGGPVRLVTDQFFSPTYAPDAAGSIVQLVDAGATGTVHVTNGSHCSPFDLGQCIYGVAGVPAEVVPITLADLPPGPPRPRYTVLAHDGLRRAGVPAPRPWPEAVAAYLSTLPALNPPAPVVQTADEMGGADSK